jgi:hypothetical protein
MMMALDNIKCGVTIIKWQDHLQDAEAQEEGRAASRSLKERQW